MQGISFARGVESGSLLEDIEHVSLKLIERNVSVAIAVNLLKDLPPDFLVLLLVVLTCEDSFELVKSDVSIAISVKQSESALQVLRVD